MNKTVTINLNGQVYQIDEDAYELLKGYLDSIHARFRNTEGGEEIMGDIESRIAEMFQANLNPRKNVVAMDDVQAMMQAMGKPEEFGDDDDQTAGTTTGSQANTSNTTTGEKVKRRLYRDEDNKFLGGVLAGLSAYIGWHDATLLRLAFLILLFLTGGTLLVGYVVMWVIVPKAVTASEKLQMKGEAINIGNIERTIREDLQELKKNLDNIDSQPGYQKARNGVSNMVAILLGILKVLLRIFKALLGIGLILGGLAVLGMIVFGVSFPNEHFSPNPALFQYVFNSQAQSILAVVAVGLVFCIPFVMFVIYGFRLLLNQRYRGRGLNFSLWGLWTVGFIIGIFLLAQMDQEHKFSKELNEKTVLPMPANKVLHIALLKDDRYNDPYYQLPNNYQLPFNGAVRVEKDMVYGKGNIKFTIIKTTDSVFSIEKTYMASGGTREDAIAKAKHITYNIKNTDSVLSLQDYLSFPVADKLRGQQVKVTLMMPEGTSVFLEKGLDAIIYDIKNTKNIYDGVMPNHLWTMTAEGLECASKCDEFTSETSGSYDGVPSHEYGMDGFTTIKTSGAFEVHVSKGDNYRVSVIATDKDLKNIEVKEDGDMLNISYDNWGIFQRSKNIKVNITTPNLEKVIGNGATHLYLDGVTNKELSVEINGASHGELTNLKVDELTIHSSGASHVHATGTATSLDVEVNGASHFDGYELITNSTHVEASGASHASVNATDKLDAEANGASHVTYKGSPSVSSNDSGASSVKPER